jgi:hypothetical protein
MRDKKTMSSKTERSSRSQRRTILIFSVVVLLIKIIWLSSQQGKELLGSDGENYLNALDGLLKDGFFSNHNLLAYWPAGYPILMWPLAELSVRNLGFIVGILQSSIFAISITFFAFELSKSSLKRYTWPAVILLTLSPTFTLNSVVIGYEVISSVLLLIATTLYLRLVRIEKKSILSWESSLAACTISISCFMQPRIMLLGLGILIPFALYHYRGRAIALFLALSMLIVAIAPAILIFRNTQAQGFAAISTNLGVTMNIGAGPNATGGYTNQVSGVPCESIEGDLAKQDSHRVGCVIKWYLKNPSSSVKLFANKFFFHWSPWFGPLANGTMGRNPWFKFHPFAEMIKTQEGFEMASGIVGKALSGAWVLGSLTLLGCGFIALRRRGGVSTLLAWILLTPVILNTASSMATIGDHRFRIPTLSLSLLLQLFGGYALLGANSFRRGIDGPVRLARGINWKGRGQGDKLLP